MVSILEKVFVENPDYTVDAILDDPKTVTEGLLMADCSRPSFHWSNDCFEKKPTFPRTSYPRGKHPRNHFNFREQQSSAEENREIYFNLFL